MYFDKLTRLKRRLRHLVQVGGIVRCFDRSEIRTLNQRRVADLDAISAQRLNRHLNTQHCAPEINQDQRAIGRSNLLQSSLDALDTCSQCAFRRPTRIGDLNFSTGYLLSKLPDSGGELSTV